MNTDKIVEKLMEAKEAYYKGDPIMSDTEFDALEDLLKNTDSTNPYFGVVGTPEIKGNKIVHLYPMLSMGKTKTVEDVQAWLGKIIDKRVQLLLEPKIDGLSASIVYENGTLKYIATRGDGKTGQDITHIIDYINNGPVPNIPRTIPAQERVEIRGEIYLPKHTRLPNPDEKPLRNLAVGLINRKDNREDIKYLNFVAYQLFVDEVYSYEHFKLATLKDYGFKVVWYQYAMSVKELKAIEQAYLNQYRSDWEYETDGLIITVNDISLHDEINSKYTVNHHNHYNIALKPPAEAKETKVKHIEWNLSRLGNLVPTVVFDKIVIGGSDIQKATGNNYENIKLLNLKKGDKILIEKANEVIPYLKQVVESSSNPFEIPIVCPSCGEILDQKGVHLHCSNVHCPEINLQKIIYWVEQSEMDGVAGSTIRTLFKEGYVSSIKDLYMIGEVNANLLLEIEGFGQSKLDNLLAQVEKSRTMTIVQFLVRLGIENVGEKAIKKLNINTYEDFMNCTQGKSVVGRNLVEFRNANIKEIEFLKSILTIQDIVVKTYIGRVCMTGDGPRPRTALKSELEDMGYEVQDSVTKTTDILICVDPQEGNSSKLQKAKKMGIKIVSYMEFFK